MKIAITLVCTMIILSGIVLIPNVFAENVPDWVKNTAGWWAEDVISETEFVNAIEYLVKEDIIQVNVSQTSEVSQGVPDWVKNTAGWWATDLISETEFVNAIKFLVTHGIIVVNYNLSCVNDLSEIFDDSSMTIKHTCALHGSSVHSELIPAIDQINYNSLGFRGTEFSETKPSDTYRIFMVGGSTMIGSGASSDETTKSGILQKIFELDRPITQKIQVINAASSGANSGTELNIITQKIIHYQPDLVVVFDGLNDLKSDFPVEKMKNNWESMCKLGNENNFDVIISLQPIPGFGNKELTQQELVNSFQGQDHNGFQLITAKSTYDYMWREMLSLQDYCNVIDLRGIYDDINGPLYWDQGHVSDTANLITAEKFHEVITELIFKEKPNKNKFHNVISKYNSPIITSYLLSKIGIDVDYNQIKKQDLTTKYKKDGNYFYLKNQLGGSEQILVGKDLSKTDLSKINLTGQDLSGANLSGKDLRKIDFTGTILRGANLSFTNLSGQDLSGMDLRGINFHNANLENADLSNITISKVIQYFEPNAYNLECSYPDDLFLNAVYQERCMIKVLKNELVRTDFSNAKMKEVTISLSGNNDFIHFVDFSGADLTGIDFSNLKFRACKFSDGTTFSNSSMNNVAFVLCDFTESKFINVEFFQAVFHNVSFHNAEIIDGSFKRTIFVDYADFSNADLQGTSFDMIDMIGNIVFNCKNNQICN